MKQEIINKIRKYLKEGKKPGEIAKQLKISVTSVYYHSNEEQRKKRIKQSVDYFKNLPKEKKKEIYQKRNDYMRDYFRTKYQTDENFRKNFLERKRNIHKKEKGGILKNE